jgi:monovalent cation:H+ antiporter, CPA1 family
MTIFDLFAIMLTLVAGFSYINQKVLKLPTTIGVMITALVFSTSLILLHQFGLNFDVEAKNILAQIDFHETLMNGMLSFLLFAGALHVDLSDLREQNVPIAVLSSIGVLISTFFIGIVTYYVFLGLGVNISFIYCLLFGALISPTDPIAVLALVKQANAPKSLETKISGESLFNDGVGVVIFTVIYQVATGKAELTVFHVAELFFTEAVGGAVFGFLIGYIGYKALKSIDDYKVEVIITLALVTGGYSLAQFIHVSGPIAMVVSGLFIGNHGRSYAMSDMTKKHLDPFWELIDAILNSALFVLIGLEVVLISYNKNILMLGLIAIPIVLLGRYFGVLLPMTVLKRFRSFSNGVVPIMTWGGLRGGISVALALSLPPFTGREILIGVTYTVVVFSVVVQGLTFKRVLRHYIKT